MIGTRQDSTFSTASCCPTLFLLHACLCSAIFMSNYHLCTQELLPGVYGDSSKAAGMWTPNLFSFSPGGPLLCNLMLVVVSLLLRLLPLLNQGVSGMGRHW